MIIAIIAIGGNSTHVYADPCLAQLNYPTIPVVYSTSNVPIIVPITATCTSNYGSQLYVMGNAYDVTSNTGLGSQSTILQSVGGGYTFSGQLGFNLPSTTQGHLVQVSTSIYTGQSGTLITAASETFQVGSPGQVSTTTTVTQPYPYTYAPPYQTPPIEHHNRNQAQPQTQDTSTIFGYVAIAAILAAVIIATAGLVTYGRRQQTPPAIWAPYPPPPR